MVFYILCGLVGLAVVITLIAMAFDDYYISIGEWIGVPFFIGIIASIIGFVVFGLFSCTTSLDAEYAYSDNLQQIATSNHLHGSFFLGSGTVDDEPVYRFYVKNDDGSFYQDWVYASDVTIVEDGGTPRIDTYDDVTASWVSPKWFHWLRVQDHEYVIHVPKGSIAPMIDLNLKG